MFQAIFSCLKEDKIGLEEYDYMCEKLGGTTEIRFNIKGDDHKMTVTRVAGFSVQLVVSLTVWLDLSLFSVAQMQNRRQLEKAVGHRGRLPRACLPTGDGQLLQH